MESSVERAAILLRAAAEFFRSVGREDDPIRDQMERNARAYESLAGELERKRRMPARGSEPGPSRDGASARTPEAASNPGEPSDALGNGTALTDEATHRRSTSPSVFLPHVDVPPRRRYLVQCWRAGANRRDPPDFEFLIADASSGADAVQQGRQRAEQLAKKMGREDRFVCRAQRC